MLNVLIDRKGVNRIQTELLLRKAQSGDTGALDTLIAAYYPQILNYCRWHTADEQQAQDAAQETFLKARCFQQLARKNNENFGKKRDGWTVPALLTRKNTRFFIIIKL